MFFLRDLQKVLGWSYRQGKVVEAIELKKKLAN